MSIPFETQRQTCYYLKQKPIFHYPGINKINKANNPRFHITL